jgi:hypothetical protein
MPPVFSFVGDKTAIELPRTKTVLPEGNLGPAAICPVTRSIRANLPQGEVGEVDATLTP